MIKKILEHKITIIIAVVVFVIVAGGAAYFLLHQEKPVLTNTAAQVMTIRQIVSADGKVDSDQHVSLSFQKGGRIAMVNVKVGDSVSAGQILASIDSRQLSASLESAKADVLSAQANLSALQKGATAQTLAVYNQNISTAKLSLSTAVRDAYLKTQDALLNKLSSVFNNNPSANPTLVIPTDSTQITNNINIARVDMTSRMSTWNSLLQKDPIGVDSLSEASKDIAAAKTFLDPISYAANHLTVNSSGLSQGTIDAYVAAINGAAVEVNAADTELNTALQSYKTTSDQLALIQASSTPEALEVAGAALTKAGANVASIQSQIADTVLTAPFDGIVASVNPKIGENFSANVVAMDIISPGAYKIDIMIPENEIAAVAVGDVANINFNAYGAGLSATGTVSSIDLSETIVNGVGAYKVSVYLNNSDSRIRTDMSANVAIGGASASNVVAIPASAIISKNGSSYALVASVGGSYIERKVDLGISDGNWTEVKSGINVGDKVATFGEVGQ